ncbi:MAG: hypothetical protein JXA99_12405 [Candidatus Lokiarchaeota archaeon]|nr:hypothetical protein [Candidatus Lokiarchaeota archaeon]
MNDNCYTYGDITLGKGNFNLPPVLIGTIFYMGQTIIERQNPSIFNKEKAKKRIDFHKELASKYNIPEMIEISADDSKSIVKYLEFYLDNYDPPFVLGGTFDARVSGIEYLNERGIKPVEYIYNSISNLKNSKEIELIRKNKIDSTIILILGTNEMTSNQKYNYLIKKDPLNKNKNLIENIKELGVKRIWIDGGVIDLESLANTFENHHLVKKSLNLPVGTAPNLFLYRYSSPRLNKKFHTRYRRASIMFISTWISNFIFYGAIEDAVESFASTYQAIELKKVTQNKNIKLFDL